MLIRPQRLLVGRAAARAAPWIEAIRAAGVESGALPLIATRPLDPGPEGRAALRRLERFDWVLFTSATAVRRLAELRGAAPWPPGTAAGAVGAATAAALEDLGVAPRLRGRGGGAELAADFLRVAPAPRGGRPALLWPAAADARPELAQILAAAGYLLTRIALYRTLALPGPAPPPGATVLLFSPSAAAVLARRAPAPAAQPVWAAGTTTAAAARAFGLPVEAVLDEPTLDALNRCLRSTTPS